MCSLWSSSETDNATLNLKARLQLRLIWVELGECDLLSYCSPPTRRGNFMLVRFWGIGKRDKLLNDQYSVQGELVVMIWVENQTCLWKERTWIHGALGLQRTKSYWHYWGAITTPSSLFNIQTLQSPSAQLGVICVSLWSGQENIGCSIDSDIRFKSTLEDRFLK